MYALFYNISYIHIYESIHQVFGAPPECLARPTMCPTGRISERGLEVRTPDGKWISAPGKDAATPWDALEKVWMEEELLSYYLLCFGFVCVCVCLN